MAGKFAASLAYGLTEFEEEEKGGQRAEGRERKHNGGHQGGYETGGTTWQKKLTKDGNNGDGIEGNLSI